MLGVAADKVNNGVIRYTPAIQKRAGIYNREAGSVIQ